MDATVVSNLPQSSMAPTGPTPRIQGRYLVVAPGTTFPKICVRTGARDDLVEIEEQARTSRAVERIAGVFGAMFAYEDAPIRYYVQRRELERLRRMRRNCQRALLLAIGGLVIGIVSRWQPLLIGCFALTCIFTSVYWLLPEALPVAAVWGRQIFLLKVPREIVDEVMKDAPAKN